jgi:hypothetical protein
MAVSRPDDLYSEELKEFQNSAVILVDKIIKKVYGTRSHT